MRAQRQNPAMEAARAAAYRAKMEDPTFRQQHAKRSQERLARWRAEGKGDAIFLEMGRRNAHFLNTDEARAKARRTRVPGIPDERWDEYSRLRRQHGAAEARRMILDDIAAQERARLAAMTPFERQLARVAAGAKLVEVKPLRRADPNFTLGGVSSSYL
ncbi:MAG: hypothetical protein INR68_18410 [Methylobacterium mesophilicum]|nr:hypothetical protein [Methylobacterium mesophilicum]